MTAEVAADRLVVLGALRRLESGEAEPGQCFDWNPGWVHGYAARYVSGVLEGVTWRQAYAALQELAAEGRVARVRVSAPLRDPELVAFTKEHRLELDHVVAVFRSVGS